MLEYQKYKLALDFWTLGSTEVDFERKDSGDQVLFNLDDDSKKNWRPLSVIDLITAFAKVLNNKSQENHLEVEMANYSVEEKIEYVNFLLDKKESFNYFDIVKEDMSKMELICIFLALLELVKQGKISIRQHLIFGDIFISKINFNFTLN